MSKQEILAVEDDENILELVKYNLLKEGYVVFCVASGEEALTAARSQLPHLVVLDLMLPGVDGLEVCKTLKRDPKTAHIPIVMLTAKGEEADVVAGLEVGAEDYITKPFNPKVLIARIRTVLRRQHDSAIGKDATIKRDGLVIHPGRHEVLVNDKPVSLTYTEFRILHFLARQPGWVFTRYQIVDAVRKGHSVVSDRSVDVQVAALRKKLGPCGDYIETVRNVGYRFKDSRDDPT